jgi:cysteine desulfurase / selenocysteine lyase
MNSKISRFSVDEIRSQFPVLSQSIRGKELVYLDNAATAQVPQVVIDAISEFHGTYRSNIHRGVHTLSQRSTTAYEAARATVKNYINAKHVEEVVFVRGTTDALNLIAHGIGAGLKEGDEVIITALEHHSNIVPWQIICERVGAVLKVAPINSAGELDMEAYRALFSAKTKFVSVIWVSNALGTVNPAVEMIQISHNFGVPVALDAAQAAPHLRIDVQALDCDFLALSGHKLYGPTGIGVLYGKRDLFETLPPYQGGGDMIEHVSFEGSTWAELPSRFEAGTPNIAGAIGLAAAIDFVSSIDWSAATAHEDELLRYANEKMGSIPSLRLVGTAADKVSVVSFVMEGAHPHDIGAILDQHGVAIRTGHHCAEPLMNELGISGTARASFAIYNTKSEIDTLYNALLSVVDLLGLEEVG